MTALRRRDAVLLAALAPLGCALPPAEAPWERRLGGDTVALLGEVHDNPDGHRLRLDVLRRAVARGWRPAIAMEQLDRERQEAVDRARRERPADVQHVLDAGVGERGRSGWDWSFYRPVLALALASDLPLVAANLSTGDATRVVRGGYAALFDAPARTALGLDRAEAPDWLAAQVREVDAGHCGALPPALLPAMARAQLARDAVMAAALREHAARGAVLLAGNGHVRKDVGVPRWLEMPWRARVVSVAFLEGDGDPELAAAVDAVVRVPPFARPDPCASFERRSRP